MAIAVIPDPEESAWSRRAWRAGLAVAAIVGVLIVASLLDAYVF